MKNILIIGANSAVANSCLNIWASRGDKLFLVGRDEIKLQGTLDRLELEGMTNAKAFGMDLNNLKKHQSMLDTALSYLKDIDIVLISHGTLPVQSICEQEVELTLSEIKTNALSTISLLTIIANRFEAKRHGTIAVISSVAGDRGRADNYIYGSAKAMVVTFISGLRQRLHNSNVNVITVKLGRIETPMTINFKKGLLWVKSDFAAKKIVSAIDMQKYIVYVPGFWKLIMLLFKTIPEAAYVKLPLLKIKLKIKP